MTADFIGEVYCVCVTVATDATLGTHIEAPGERLKAIRASVQHAKVHIQSLPRQALMQYTMALFALSSDRLTW